MRILAPLLLLITLAMFSCKKETVNENIGTNNNNNNQNTTHTGITYPDSAMYDNSSMTYGRNILSMADNSVFSEPTNYTIAATLEADAHLRIVFTNYPFHDSTYWSYASGIGFNLNNIDAVTTELVSTQTGTIYLPINFIANGYTGSCKIDFYENGSAITRTKHFTWHQ
jgi:hypothetical protein